MSTTKVSTFSSQTMSHSIAREALKLYRRSNFLKGFVNRSPFHPHVDVQDVLALLVVVEIAGVATCTPHDVATGETDLEAAEEIVFCRRGRGAPVVVDGGTWRSSGRPERN